MPAHRLVGSNIHGTNGDWSTLHALHGQAIGLVLLFLVGQFARTPHEQKLAAKQPHTDRAHVKRGRSVFWQFNIDQQLHPLAVERAQPGASGPTKIRIDVAKLTTFPDEKFRMLERFLRMIQVQRQDFNGKVITVRAHDTRAIAVMLDVPVDEVGDELAKLGLIFIPPTQ